MPDDETVGYCKPPVQNRFKKGQSGNPRGRPRKAKPPAPANTEAAILQKIDDEIVSAGGREMTRLELELRIVHRKASQGDMGALRLLNQKRADLKLQAPEKANNGSGVLILPVTLPFDEWDAMAAAQQAKYRETQPPDTEGARDRGDRKDEGEKT